MRAGREWKEKRDQSEWNKYALKQSEREKMKCKMDKSTEVKVRIALSIEFIRVERVKMKIKENIG